MYGGDNVSDKCPIEAVKLYLDQKLKEIYKTKMHPKKERLQPGPMPSIFVWPKAIVIEHGYLIGAVTAKELQSRILFLYHVKK